MKVADYVIQFLADKGIDRIFILYGAANGPLIDAFTRVKNTKHVCAMHEQGAGFMAEGWSKVAGLPACAIVTSGPGAQNLVTPIANCFYDSVPAIFISGQINSNFMRPDPSIRQVGFQECDIVSIVTPITKYAVMVTDPTEIRCTLERAWHVATADGRPGPVLLDIPVNVQSAEIDPEQLVGYDIATTHVFAYPSLEESCVDFMADFQQSERPIILVGGGLRWTAKSKLLTLSAVLSCPIIPTWNAMDIATSDWPLYGGRVGTYGGPGRNLAIQNCDLLLSIGSRISGRITGGNVKTFARGAKKYLVDIDEPMLDRSLQQVPFDVNILGDAELFIDTLLSAYGHTGQKTSQARYDWIAKVCRWRDQYDPVKECFFEEGAYKHDGVSYVHPYAFIRTLSEKVDKDAIIVFDLGGISVLVGHAFKTKQGQRLITNNGNAPMGFALAAAIGAKIAAPDRQVICIIGDGGMNMNIQELQTIVNYGVDVKVFVMNNHIYGITKAFQETNFQGRTPACGPEGYNPPDFLAIATAYDIDTSWCLFNLESAEVIDDILNHAGPVVCDVNMHEYHTYEPRIFGWNTPIEDQYPYLPRNEFRAQMTVEPIEGWETPQMPFDSTDKKME